MSDIRSAEDVAREVLSLGIGALDAPDLLTPTAADLIRARDAEVRADERAKVLAKVAGRVPFDHTPDCMAEKAYGFDWHPDCGACWQDRIESVGSEE